MNASLTTVVVVLAVIALLLGVAVMFKSRKKRVSVPLDKNNAGGWYLWWSILLVIVGVAVAGAALYGVSRGFPQAPSPGAVWEWTKDYWLWVVLVLAFPFGLLFIANKPWAKGLQWFLAAVAVGLFVAVPLIDTVWGESSAELGEKAATTICPDASARETHSCVITTSWSNKIKIGDPEANGMLLCALPGGAVLGKTYERLEENGTTFWRFRTEEGNVVKTYRLIRANEACPATL